MEQPLPPDGACNLGSINLSEFVKNPYTDKAHFDMNEFKEAVGIATEGLDEVIDYGYKHHALKEQREMSYNYRNIGLGVMGLGSMFLKMGIKYGDKDSIELADNIMYNMFRSAVKRSNELAKEKGVFPKYKDVVFDSDIIKNHFTKEEIQELKKHGLRNCSLLSVAPSGSIATMFNITTGCEPAFRISYKRKTESLHKNKELYYDVYIREAEEYKKINNTNILPDYFVGADQINYKDRIKMQSVLQKHVDTAISSTINLPNNSTIEEVEELYLEAWKQGLKGVTIYRNGCKRKGILIQGNKKEEAQKQKYNTIEPISRSEIGKTYGSTVRKHSACGKLYITINRDKEGNIVESFVNVGKNGICKSNIDGINRLISLGLRSGVKIDEIVDQLRGINCPACTRVRAKGESIDGLSCPDIMARTLQNEYKNINEKPKIEKKKNTCPECGEELAFEGNCISCKHCGFSKCE